MCDTQQQPKQKYPIHPAIHLQYIPNRWNINDSNIRVQCSISRHQYIAARLLLRRRRRIRRRYVLLTIGPMLGNRREHFCCRAPPPVRRRHIKFPTVKYVIATVNTTTTGGDFYNVRSVNGMQSSPPLPSTSTSSLPSFLP